MLDVCGFSVMGAQAFLILETTTSAKSRFGGGPARAPILLELIPCALLYDAGNKTRIDRIDRLKFD